MLLCCNVLMLNGGGVDLLFMHEREERERKKTLNQGQEQHKEHELK